MSQKTLDEYETDGTVYKDKETLERLYWDEELSQNDIAEFLDVSHDTITRWFKKHGIQARSKSEALELAQKRAGGVPLSTTSAGYTRWVDRSGDGEVFSVHRLVAVTEYGIDAIKNMHVHHKNGIQWDNRPDNLELMDSSNHASHHNTGEESNNAQLSECNVRRIKQRLESGQETQREIAKNHPVTERQISAIKSGECWSHVEPDPET